ncbi:MAG: TonB-dependent receptor plug domain-containing protein [Polyangiales bacterium]
MKHLPALLAVLALLWSGRTHAQYGARAEVEAPPVASDDADRTAAGSSVEIEESDDLNTALARVPGAQVAQTGGLGAASYLRLRGAELAQTEVVLGGIPLRGPDSGAFDLGLLSAHMFESLRVYRGGAPAELSTAALGGVLVLEPHRAQESSVSAFAAGGTFSTWGVGGGANLVRDHGRTRFSARLALEGSDNDYPYLDDHGTAFNTDDDRTLRRANAQQTRTALIALLERDLDEGRLTALVMAGSRLGGEPGAGLTRAQHAQRHDVHTFGALRYDVDLGAHELFVTAGAGSDRRKFSDRFNEIGFGREEAVDQWTSGFIRAGSVLRPHRALDITVVGGGRLDGYAPTDSVGPSLPSVQRWTGFGSVEARLHGALGPVRLELRPSIRLERTRVSETGPDTQVPSSSTQPSYRIGLLVAPVSWLSVSASASRGRRLPTLQELLGDRGAVVRSPDLRAETGRTLDAGIVLQSAGAFAQVGVEVRGFHTRAEDLIRFIPTSQYTAAARNVDEAIIAGAEFGSRLTLARHVVLDANGTWLSTDDGRERELNWRPSLSGRVRARLQSGPLGNIRNAHIEVQLRHRSSFFQDPANFVELPANTWLDFAGQIQMQNGLAFGLSVRDALDERGQDFIGYPLPGRQVMATLQIESDL